MTFHKAGIVLYIGLIFFEFLYILPDFKEDIGNWLLRIAACSVQVRVTWFYIQFYSCYAGSILSAIVLFFHQQVQLVKTIHYCTIFLKIIRKRLSQANVGKATFMFYFVTHDGFTEEGAKLQ
jgi:hypothetical protein